MGKVKFPKVILIDFKCILLQCVLIWRFCNVSLLILDMIFMLVVFNK